MKPDSRREGGFGGFIQSILPRKVVDLMKQSPRTAVGEGKPASNSAKDETRTSPPQTDKQKSKDALNTPTPAVHETNID